jgi:hypothetical protein
MLTGMGQKTTASIPAQEQSSPSNGTSTPNQVEQRKAGMSPDQSPQMHSNLQQQPDESIKLPEHKNASDLCESNEVQLLIADMSHDHSRQMDLGLQLQPNSTPLENSSPSDDARASKEVAKLNSNLSSEQSVEQHLPVKTFYGKSSRGRNLKRYDKQYSPPPLTAKKRKH